MCLEVCNASNNAELHGYKVAAIFLKCIYPEYEYQPAFREIPRVRFQFVAYLCARGYGISVCNNILCEYEHCM